jgi:hypothetical protein
MEIILSKQEQSIAFVLFLLIIRMSITHQITNCFYIWNLF